jgi:hypothetical protein
MNMIRNALRRWLLGDGSVKVNDAPILSGADRETHDNVTFGVVKAENGTILKVSRYKPNPRGSDWVQELHIVKDGETVVDVFRTVYATHLLESK